MLRAFNLLFRLLCMFFISLISISSFHSLFGSLISFFICSFKGLLGQRSDGQGKQDELITNTISFSLFYCNGRRIQSTNTMASNGNAMWERERVWESEGVQRNGCYFISNLQILMRIVNHKSQAVCVCCSCEIVNAIVIICHGCHFISICTRDIFLYVCESKKAKLR